jgi:hypothetical protein
MNSRKDIQSELIQLNSSLPFDAKMPVFDLPEGYFENFASGVLATVKGKPAVSADEELASLSPLLAGMSKQMPFTLPENYFSTQVPTGLGPASEDPLPEWLHHSRNMPYVVPEGYFDGLAGKVLQQTTNRQQAKVVGLFSRTWVRYAAAAVILGALIMGALFYPASNTISPVSEPEAWVEKKLRNVSNQDLEAFIETVEVTGTASVRKPSGSKPEVRRLLKDVPDSELEAFLNQLPEGAENLN